jgi:hypothetical protein
MDKYYWVCWEWENTLGKYIVDDVFTEHPFKVIKDKRRKLKGHFTIMNFKEISKEEYEMFDLELKYM